MKVFAISDMHGQLEGLDPKGVGLVVVAGDFAVMRGWSPDDYAEQLHWIQAEFCEWCAGRPDIPFCVIPGNHDLFAQQERLRESIKWPENVRFLIDREVEVCGLRVYGTPWIPFINGYWAFEEQFPGQLREQFAKIPEGLDILITHSPPKIRHKKIDVSIDTNSPHFGSPDLTDAIFRAAPRYAFCGHIHSGDHVRHELINANGRKTVLYNVSRLGEEYQIKYEPLILEI